MASPDLPGAEANAQAFADSRFGPQAVVRLRAAFERSRHPMLIADDPVSYTHLTLPTTPYV